MLYVNNLYNFNIITWLSIFIIMLFMSYIVDFIEFKKFAKKYYFINIRFLPFTYDLIKTKIRVVL